MGCATMCASATDTNILALIGLLGTVSPYRGDRRDLEITPQLVSPEGHQLLGGALPDPQLGAPRGHSRAHGDLRIIFILLRSLNPSAEEGVEGDSVEKPDTAAPPPPLNTLELFSEVHWKTVPRRAPDAPEGLLPAAFQRYRLLGLARDPAAPTVAAAAAFLDLATGLRLGPSPPLPTALWWERRTRALGETVFRVSLAWLGGWADVEETQVYLEVLWAPAVTLSLGDSFLPGVFFREAVGGPLPGVLVPEAHEETEAARTPAASAFFTQVNFDLLTGAGGALRAWLGCVLAVRGGGGGGGGPLGCAAREEEEEGAGLDGAAPAVLTVCLIVGHILVAGPLGSTSEVFFPWSEEVLPPVLVWTTCSALAILQLLSARFSTAHPIRGNASPATSNTPGLGAGAPFRHRDEDREEAEEEAEHCPALLLRDASLSSMLFTSVRDISDARHPTPRQDPRAVADG
ncbi:hypothetical protein CRUP_000700 [Coryphaenoides rupestris]|nr:hypothetical protein CRUP_000700 [Coryphaenoides rupestris]